MNIIKDLTFESCTPSSSLPHTSSALFLLSLAFCCVKFGESSVDTSSGSLLISWTCIQPHAHLLHNTQQLSELLQSPPSDIKARQQPRSQLLQPLHRSHAMLGSHDLPYWQNFVASSASPALAALFTNPIEVIKVAACYCCLACSLLLSKVHQQLEGELKALKTSR